MELLKQNLNRVKVPGNGERIYKDECVFSFDTPESVSGLYVCLNTFLGFGKDFVGLHHRKTGNSIYLHLCRIKREKPRADDGDGEKKPKLTRLGIGPGVPGLAVPDGDEYDETNSIVILPSFDVIPLPNADLPPVVAQSVAGVLATESASKLEQLQAAAGTWDGEKRKVTKFANNLLQLENCPKLPPMEDWKCEKCDLKSNLWMNLTDGKILCGRKMFDGSGGNGHAEDHYRQTKYPLCVKLRSISPQGADVFSYEEDDMVEDPKIAKHLRHFGINIEECEKHEKSMLELELEYNERIGEWAVIQETDSVLTPLYGPGYTGLANLGNSCYLNSVIQVLFSVPDFQSRYYPPDVIFEQSPPNPTQDFNTQMAKIAFGLLSGKYSIPLNASEASLSIDQVGVKPTMFKNLVGKGHPEFSTNRQQDVQEFFLHLINLIERNHQISGAENPVDCLRFQIEERIECAQSKKVKYTTRNEYLLSLPIPLDKAINKQEVREHEQNKSADGKKHDVRLKIPLNYCFDAFAAPEIIDDFYSTAVNGKTTAKKTTRIKSFPDYLMLQLKKFTLDDNWAPKKLNVSIEVPEKIDLVAFRGNGLQPHEDLLPEGTAPGVELQEAVNFDPIVVTQLSEMGFSANACQRALYNTQNTGVEAALNWLFEHQADSDFNSPLNLNKKSRRDSFTPDPSALESLKAMGLAEDHAIRGLKETGNNVERAVDWIFCHQEELTTPMHVDSGAECLAAASCGPVLHDGSEKYALVAFISHMGTSTMCGHYACHIFKDGRWVIFNDNKVALSEKPPKDLGYLYLYRRI